MARHILVPQPCGQLRWPSGPLAVLASKIALHMDGLVRRYGEQPSGDFVELGVLILTPHDFVELPTARFVAPLINSPG